MNRLTVSTSSTKQFVDVTQKVKSVVSDAGFETGVCLIYVPHTTAGVTINESADSDVVRDILTKLRDLVPSNDSYRHREGNADAHIQSSLVGNTSQIIVQDGNLKLGTWQGIFFCEFDGPREREIWVSFSS